jgi:hypothetical protein
MVMIIYIIETLGFNHEEKICNKIITIPKLTIKNIYKTNVLK